jgi:exopolyphosphatase/guanosine-5'-triphosphate,3'-diphosphate pyrophosphatase
VPHRVPDVLAAVDLGSNSFHMIVARYNHGQLIVLDRLREMVRLAAGLDEHGRLSRESTQRALQCLERFGQRLRDMRAESVRVVGTNTLRKAKRRGVFLERARDALGHPIEIISGVEEARLIHLGVAHTTPNEGGHRLVVDIGGGSTELIIGEGLAAKRLESLYMGCVSFSARFFPDGEITEKRMKRARTAAHLELEPVINRFRRSEWDIAYGASGTLRAVADTLQAREPAATHVDRAGLEWLLQETLRAGQTSRLRLPGLSPERLEVLPGGLAILLEVFDRLGIETMRIADGALREGLLYDLLGRLTDEDARVRSVRAMEGRFHVDTAQADRVEATALAFLRQARDDWGLDDPLAEPMLGWAARLHEVGLDIAHSQYQRHGAYLLQHADLPGFPSHEQQLLAAIVGGHRRKLLLAGLDDLMPPWHLKALYLIVLLRLAVLLHRGRGPRSLPDIRLAAKGKSVELTFPRGWLDEHPLTAIDLEQEAGYLEAAGVRLKLAA